MHIVNWNTIVVFGTPNNKYNVFSLQGTNIINWYLGLTCTGLPWSGYSTAASRWLIWSNDGILYMFLQRTVSSIYYTILYSLVFTNINELNVVSWMTVTNTSTTLV